MKPAVTLLIVIGLLAALWSRAAVKVTDPGAVFCGVGLTQDLYARIDKGMSVREVQELIGAGPTEQLCTRGVINEQERVEIYTWTDASKRSISVCFRDGVFQHKDQAWL